jgi:hypothetical protein
MFDWPLLAALIVLRLVLRATGADTTTVGTRRNLGAAGFDR